MAKSKKKAVAYLFPLEKYSYLQSEYLLSNDTVTIGRHPNNMITIFQEAVSRHHAKIERSDDAFLLTDLNSSNGTFVNSEQVSSHELKEGDIVTMGDIEFGFSYKPSEERESENIEDTETTVSVVPEDEDDSQFTTILSTKPSDSTPLPLVQAALDEKPDLIKSNMRLATLYRLSDLLRDAQDRKTILERVMNLIFDVLPADRGVILYYSKDNSGHFEPLIVKYRGDEPISKHSIAISRTIVERSAREKIAILSRDARTDERFENSESIMMHDIRSAMCVPLIAKGKVLGILHIDTKESVRAFTESDLTFLSSLANELAISLDNLDMRYRMIQQEKMAAIGQTITDVAHNIKNILQLTKGGAQLMDKSLDEGNMENARASWQIIRRGEEKIGRFIRDMLDFSRSSYGKKKSCNINEIITEIASSVRDELENKNVRLELDLDDSIEDRRFSEDGLYKCIMNIIMNAAEAINHEDGLIKIESRSLDDCLVLKISDNGEGIPPDVMRFLFNPFFTTKGSKGTGLGLCTTKKIVEENNGTIEVESTFGEGATFTLTFNFEDTKIGDG